MRAVGLAQQTAVYIFASDGDGCVLVSQVPYTNTPTRPRCLHAKELRRVIESHGITSMTIYFNQGRKRSVINHVKDLSLQLLVGSEGAGLDVNTIQDSGVRKVFGRVKGNESYCILKWETLLSNSLISTFGPKQAVKYLDDWGDRASLIYLAEALRNE